MKKNNKGFLLVETLVVSTFCLTVLIVLFLQFKTLVVNYNTSFKYNTVEGIYNLGAVKRYFQDKNISLNDFSSNPYVYKGESFSNKCDNFCKELVAAMDVKVLVYTSSILSANLRNDTNLSVGMRRFIAQLKDNADGNRLIVEFNDGTYASITYKNGEGQS